MFLRHLARLSSTSLLRSHNQLWIRPQSARWFSHELVANWPEGIKRFLEQEKIEKPTLIQEKTLPIAMENKNLVGIARTGSGKTLAFVIPAVMKVLKAKEENQKQIKIDDDHDERPAFMRQGRKATCLVLAPTRELAAQTSSVFDKFRRLGLNSVPLVGGSSRSDQMRQLQRADHDVYVATPGRLMDLVDSEVVDLSGIKYLVLDEADRMLDMGFEPQIRRILECIPEDRQTLMWSATWPQEIQSLATEFLRDFEYIAVDSENLKANPNIRQIVEVCEPHGKLEVMLEHINQFKEECNEPRILIFVNTKRLADTLLIQLMRNRIKAISIHGDRSQKQRDDALRMFKNRMCHVLVATDVAARGLDISDITHVVNFDFPNTVEDYIHRIGRTARHERNGTAVSLFTVNNANLAGKLVQVLRETNQKIPDKLEEFARNKHRYLSEARDFSKKRSFQRNDFYSGRSTGRLQGQNRGGYNQGDQRSRYADDDDDDNHYGDRQFNRSYENQDRRRYRASNVFED